MMLFSFTSILGGLKEELVLTNTQFGLLLSAFSIAFAVAQIPGGVLSDKFGGKMVCLVGVSVKAIANKPDVHFVPQCERPRYSIDNAPFAFDDPWDLMKISSL